MGLFFKKVSPPTYAPSRGQEVWGETCSCDVPADAVARVPSRLFPLHRADADVAAAEAFRPVDPVNGGISTCPRFGDVLPERGDAKHAAAVGEDAAPSRLVPA